MLYFCLTGIFERTFPGSVSATSKFWRVGCSTFGFAWSRIPVLHSLWRCRISRVLQWHSGGIIGDSGYRWDHVGQPHQQFSRWTVLTLSKQESSQILSLEPVKRRTTMWEAQTVPEYSVRDLGSSDTSKMSDRLRFSITCFMFEKSEFSQQPVRKSRSASLSNGGPQCEKLRRFENILCEI